MIYTNKGDAFYDELPGLRASHLKVLYGSTPLHMLHAMSNREDSDAMRVGRALHTAVLQPDQFEQLWSVAPKVDRRTKAGKETWEAFCEMAAGRGVITADEAEVVNGIQRSLSHGSFLQLLDLCESREVIFTGEIAGHPVKCRVDACGMESGLLIDLKTTVSASRRSFTKSIVDFGYLLQMAFYREIMGQNGVPHGGTVLVACEKSAPYASALYALQDSDMERMAEAIEPLVASVRQCAQNDDFPGYPQRITTIAMPEWAFKHEGEHNDEA